MTVISYLGQIRDTECRNIMQENVQMTAQGISVTIQREDKESKVFFISNEACQDGINYASIIHTYREALKMDDVQVLPTSPFLFTGKKDGSKSKFVNSALGNNPI